MIGNCGNAFFQRLEAAELLSRRPRAGGVAQPFIGETPTAHAGAFPMAQNGALLIESERRAQQSATPHEDQLHIELREREDGP